MNSIVHGGDLDFIEKFYNIPKDEILDFSSNVNPLGSPESVKKILVENINVIDTYPDKDYTKLKNSIIEYINFDTNIKNLLVGNGTTELISIFIKTLQPKNSLIISPSYSEYEREIKNNNGKVEHFILSEENDFNLCIESLINSLKDVDLLVICNPNNPTGTAIHTESLEEILNFCNKNGTFVMIDETYAEFVDANENISAISLAKKYKNLFIIRGTSKFFCVPGIRLGYAICCNNDIINKIEEKKDPWSVNSLANLAGITLFNDKNFILETLKLINLEKNKIYNNLNNIKDLKYYKSYSNFILVKILNKNITSKLLFEKLLENKIFIRDTSNFKGLNESFFRFCILNPKENDFLLTLLNNLFK